MKHPEIRHSFHRLLPRHFTPGTMTRRVTSWRPGLLAGGSTPPGMVDLIDEDLALIAAHVGRVPTFIVPGKP